MLCACTAAGTNTSRLTSRPRSDLRMFIGSMISARRVKHACDGKDAAIAQARDAAIRRHRGAPRLGSLFRAPQPAPASPGKRSCRPARR